MHHPIVLAFGTEIIVRLIKVTTRLGRSYPVALSMSRHFGNWVTIDAANRVLQTYGNILGQRPVLELNSYVRRRPM